MNDGEEQGGNPRAGGTPSSAPGEAKDGGGDASRPSKLEKESLLWPGVRELASGARRGSVIGNSSFDGGQRKISCSTSYWVLGLVYSLGESSLIGCAYLNSVDAESSSYGSAEAYKTYCSVDVPEME